MKFNPDLAKSSLSEAGTRAEAKVLQAYYQLKDALVATDNKKAALAAKEMSVSLKNLKINLIAGLVDSSEKDQNMKLMVLSDRLSAELSNVLKANEPDCERMRIYFKPVSDLMYTLLKESGMKDIQAYHHYCPMAMNERGAYWLSVSPDIENPYFGQKMLTCGELVDTIK